MVRVLIAVLCAAVSGVTFVSARQQPTFHSAADMVSVYATVLDNSGRLVTGLTADEFEVFDNGRRQTLTVFANDLQPITIVIMLDRSGSMVRHFELVRKAAERFVENLLEADRARVGSFSNRIQIDPAEFTGDRRALVRILRDNLQEAGTTPLWNATAAAMTALAREPGRRVVLLFTDGLDTPDARRANVTFREVRDRSVAENIMVYGIGFSSGCGRPSVGQGWPGLPRFQEQRRPGRRWPPIGPPPMGRPPVRMPPGGPIGGGPVPGDVIGRTPPAPDAPRATCLETGPDPDLRELALVGGGGYFELTNANDLEDTFARVADELHQQYLLAFRPEVLDGRTHTIEVRVRRPGLVSRARTSYLAEVE